MHHRYRNNRLQRATGMLMVGMLLVWSNAVTALAQVAVDPALKPYEKVSGVSGNLNSIGSDTWTLAFFASLTLVDTENVARRGDNRSVSPPPDRPSPARCVRVRSDVDARHQLENASVPWRGHDSSAIVKMPGPERLLQTTFLSLRRTAPESQPNPIAA